MSAVGQIILEKLKQASLFKQVDTLVVIDGRKEISPVVPAAFVVPLSQQVEGRPFITKPIHRLRTRMGILMALDNTDTAQGFPSLERMNALAISVRTFLQGNFLTQGGLWFRTGKPLETADDIVWWLDEYEHFGILNTERN